MVSRSEKRLQMLDLVDFPHRSQWWNYILGDAVCPANCRQLVLTVTCNKYHVINRIEQVIFIQLVIHRAVEVSIRLYSISESTWLWLANKALSQCAGCTSLAGSLAGGQVCQAADPMDRLQVAKSSGAAVHISSMPKQNSCKNLSNIQATVPVRIAIT